SFFLTLHGTHFGLMQVMKKNSYPPPFSFCMRKFLFVVILLLLSNSSFGQSLYSATGKASFYGRKFVGRRTASGEIFSNKILTAAHRSLPFGTLVKVTNQSN